MISLADSDRAVLKIMHDTAIRTPDWLRDMEDILEELNEGVVIVDDELRVVFANGALVRLCGYEREEMRGLRPGVIFPSADLPYVMRQKEIGDRNGNHRHEFYMPCKDGQKTPVIYSARVIQAPNGRKYTLVLTADISSQKSIEERLRESNALLEKRQEEMKRELELAERVQQSLAPQGVVWNDLVVETFFSAARSIGGDFAIAFPHGDQFFSLLVCDVSGHGIGSALIANRIYSEAMHELERSTDPGVLLQRLHAFALARLAVDGFYFTMAVVRFGECGRMTFAAAGNPPLMLVSKGAVHLLDSQAGILGCLLETMPSASASHMELAPGDRVILYTDGLIEVFDGNGEMLGVQGLAELVRRSARLPVAEMKQAILEGVTAWGDGSPADDVSLLIVEVR